MNISILMVWEAEASPYISMKRLIGGSGKARRNFYENI
ncbi:hypothetical protein CHCC20335_3631 [Bacillus paralicheniformis]|nr:hypothetical protein CHCC20335_3631 [Bacillus paralicheniformis]